MPGLKPMKVYLYSKEGKYERDFESIADFARTFNFADNIFSRDEIDDIYEFIDGRIASLRRIGRKGVLAFKEYQANKFVGEGKKRSETYYKRTNKGKVILYDLDGDKIAEFRSPYQAILITGNEQMFRNPKVGKKVKTRDGYIIEILPLK